MGVAVLNPQDCLKNPLSASQDLLSLSRVKPPRNPNPGPNRSNRAPSNRRKRSPNPSPPSRAAILPKISGPVMGQVKILKRGEQLPERTSDMTVAVEKKKLEDLDLGSVNRLGPEPDLVPTQMRVGLAEPNTEKTYGFYAGSAYISSPPPSSVPLPAFFMKKSSVVDATSDLRRILGLSI